jgi:hypothetical protein
VIQSGTARLRNPTPTLPPHISGFEAADWPSSVELRLDARLSHISRPQSVSFAKKGFDFQLRGTISDVGGGGGDSDVTSPRLLKVVAENRVLAIASRSNLWHPKGSLLCNPSPRASPPKTHIYPLEPPHLKMSNSRPPSQTLNKFRFATTTERTLSSPELSMPASSLAQTHYVMSLLPT